MFPEEGEWTSVGKFLKIRRPALRVLEIAIDNPPYNLLNGDILYGISNVLRGLSPKDIGSVILSSALDDIFISHYDVQEIAELGSNIPFRLSPSLLRATLTAETALSYLGFRSIIRRTFLAGTSHLNMYHECTALLRSIPQVTIAKINGRALGGGCELALACDFRIMVDTPLQGVPGAASGSGIGQPEVVLGLLPGGGGTHMLSRILGPAQALEMCLERPIISADEALKIGLISRIASRGNLDQEVLTLAQRQAKRSPTSVAAIKSCVHIGGSENIHSAMQREKAHFAYCAFAPESQVAMREYINNIDGFLGSDDGLQALEPLIKGDFCDFISLK